MAPAEAARLALTPHTKGPPPRWGSHPCQGGPAPKVAPTPSHLHSAVRLGQAVRQEFSPCGLLHLLWAPSQPGAGSQSQMSREKEQGRGYHLCGQAAWPPGLPHRPFPPCGGWTLPRPVSGGGDKTRGCWKSRWHKKYSCGHCGTYKLFLHQEGSGRVSPAGHLALTAPHL